MKLEEVTPFLEYVKKKTIVSANTASSWTSALKAVTEVLSEDEKQVEFVIANEAVIRNRLQNHSTEISGETIGLYVRRAQHALTSFTEWKADRAEWEKKQASKARTDISKPKKNQSKATPNSIASTAPVTDSAPSAHKIIPIACDSGGQFLVHTPENYNMNDLIRLVWALSVHAEDFDPAAVLKLYGKPTTSAPKSIETFDVIN